MPRYALRVEYIGYDFCGSQIQPNCRTIQDELEKAVCTLIKHKIRIIFSGRTDAGVNSIGQFVHFDLVEKIENFEKFMNCLNGILPSEISVNDLREVDCDFHSQKSAKWRWYRYVLVNRNQRSAWDNNFLLIRHKINVERINEALKYLRGENDFSAFKSSKSENPAKICHMYIAECQRKEDKVIFDFVANRFLYNMVRTIVGTALEIDKEA